MSVGSWKTKPTAWGSGRRRSTEPVVGAASPAIKRSAVLLPQPEGPSRARSSPGPTIRSSPASASMPPANRLVTWRSRTTGSGPGAGSTRTLELHAHPLVDEPQGVGLGEIDRGRVDAGPDHRGREQFPASVGHGADPQPQGAPGLHHAGLA